MFFEGVGNMLYDIVNDKEYLDGAETYEAKLIKINNNPDIQNKVIKSNKSKDLEDDLCDVLSGVVSTAVGYVTKDAYRPIGNCYGRKNGGGYYYYGNIGPGSIKPYWTQTLYIPREWSMCKTRKYTFHVESKGSYKPLKLIEDFADFMNGIIDVYGTHVQKKPEMLWKKYLIFIMKGYLVVT